ncbi:MAG: hypothetical protein NTX88_08145 [Candidatus Atribacteria bacterium]|nr:hypothetical protein [Candidatus Atribacteria bacterium]
MAVTAVEQVNWLHIRFEEGLDPESGRMQTSSPSWGNVKAAAQFIFFPFLGWRSIVKRSVSLILLV